LSRELSRLSLCFIVSFHILSISLFNIIHSFDAI
jgi:hypothetical protein